MDGNTLELLKIVIPLIGTLFSGWLAYKMAQLKVKVETVSGDVLRVEKATDGLTKQLVAATQVAAHGEGKEEARVEQRQADAQQAMGMKSAREQDAAAAQVSAAGTQKEAAAIQKLAADKVAGDREIPRGSNTP